LIKLIECNDVQVEILLSRLRSLLATCSQPSQSVLHTLWVVQADSVTFWCGVE